MLYKLANATGDILEDIALIESLEYSKKLSTEIQEKVEIAKVTEENINVSSEFYRPAASRGALVFFLMNELYKIHSFYKFSLDSFVIVVNRAIDIVAARDKKAKDDEGGGAEVGGVGVAREGRRRVLLGAGMPVLVDRAQGAAAGQVSARVQAVCGRCMTCSMFVCILAIVCETCALANKIHDAPSVVLSCS